MSKNRSDHKRILAIVPNSRGFGFAALEASDRLVDWGTVHVRTDKHKRCLMAVAKLTTRYEPDVLVTEEPENPRRGKRIRKLLAAVHQQTIAAGTTRKAISTNHVHKAFRGSGKVTKHTIAQGIAERFPELGPRLPPPRKPWMSEDHQMAMFQAVALALTLTYSSRHKVAKK